MEEEAGIGQREGQLPNERLNIVQRDNLERKLKVVE